MQAFISAVLSHVEFKLHVIGFGRTARNLCKLLYQKCSAMTHHAGQVQLPGQVSGAAFLGSLFTKKGALKKLRARVRAKANGKSKAKPGTKAKAKTKPAADAPAAGASAEFPPAASASAESEPAAESPAAGASAESEPAAEAPAASASEEPEPAAEALAASASGESEPAAKAPAASASGESEPAAEAPAEQTKKANRAKAKAEPKGKPKAKAKAKAVASAAAADAEVPSAVETPTAADAEVPSAVETPTAPSVVFCGWCNLPCELHCGRYTTKSQHSQTSCLQLYMTTHSHTSRYQHCGTHRVHSLIYDRTLITNMIKHFIDFQNCLQLFLYVCRNSFSRS
jgi:hypothetical protein